MRIFPQVSLDPVVDAVLVDEAVVVHSVNGYRAQLVKNSRGGGAQVVHEDRYGR